MSGSKALENYFNRFMISRLLGNITVFSSDILYNKLHVSSLIIYGSGFFFFYSTGIPWSYTDAWAISKKPMKGS